MLCGEALIGLLEAQTESTDASEEFQNAMTSKGASGASGTVERHEGLRARRPPRRKVLWIHSLIDSVGARRRAES